MLTSEHAIAAYRDGRIVPDRLTSRTHARYPLHAERILAIYREGTGRTRRDLHRDVRAVFNEEPDCPVRRIEAFCKLLDDVGDFERDRSERNRTGRSATLRREVFHKAAALHPLVRQPDRLFEHGEEKAKEEIARALGRSSWEAIEHDLFADVMEFHRLRAFPIYPDARALLSRYNVAQVQVALYGAVRMTVRATRDFKTILRYAKLARLLHGIHRTPQGYEIALDGPASILRETRRYGVAMAKFLPALLACGGWKMRATVKTPRAGRLVTLDLSPEDGLTSHLPPPGDFDSSVEEGFAQKWGDGPREGWTLIREGEILHQDQKVFVPDFVFRHGDGREVPMEIVGFWTPEYLEAKRKTLRAFRGHRILLAVAEGLRKERPEPYEDVIFFKGAIRVKDAMERLCGSQKTSSPQTRT